MLKKLMLLASAVAAVMAFAIPASASAEGTILHDGVPIATGQHVTLHLTGRATFDIPDVASSFGCDIHSVVTLESGHPSSGTATFEITTEECEGTGLLAGCELETDSTNGPWQVAVGSEDFTVTGPGGGAPIEIQNGFKSGCFTPASQLTFPAVTATPDNSEAISSVELFGEGEDDITGLPIIATGNLAVTEAGTYGIE